MASKRETEHEQQKEQAQAPENPEATTEGAEQESGEPRMEASGAGAEQSAELQEARARHLRLAADFENYKKRVRQEQLETIQYAAATLAERLLPVLDDAQRALEHAPEGADEGWLRGVRLTFQHLEEALASVGVELIESVGQPFDPKHHEAIGSEESAEHPEDTVVAELRRGYRMHDRVLRPALVKVSRRPAADGQGD